MSSCPLCHLSPVEESGSCRFCGASARIRIKKLGERGTKDRLEEASAAIEKNYEGLDLKVARRLLEEGLTALGNGDLKEASRTGEALRRGIELARQRSTWLKRIGRAKTVVEKASTAGVNVGRAKVEIARLEERVEQGRLNDISKTLGSILNGINPPSRIGSTKKSIAVAWKKINYAMERGGTTARAMELLKSAEAALEESDVPRASGLIKQAMRAADYAKKNARALQLISNVERGLQKTAARGADVAEGKELLKKARKALKSGIYADVQKWTRAARDFSERARRRKVAEDAIQRVEMILEGEAGEASDLSAARPLLEEARKALKEDRFSAITKSLQRCRVVVKEVVRLRKSRESLELLKGELAEIQSMKADTSRAEAAFSKAEKALEAGHWSAFRKHSQSSSRATRKARREREKHIIFTTVEKIVERAGKGGVSALGARELLAEVEKALGQGRHTDIDGLVEAKFEAEAAKKENEILRGVGELRTTMAELKIAGLEVSGALALLDNAEEALEARELSQAQEVLQRAREAAEPLTEALKGSAERSVKDLDEEVAKLRNLDIQAPEAEEFLERTRKALDKGNSFEALDLARIAMEACRQAREERLAEIPSADVERTKGMATEESAREMIQHARKLYTVLERAGIPAAALDDSVERVEEALKLNDVERLNLRLLVLGELGSSLEASLWSQLNAWLEGPGKLLEESSDVSKATKTDLEEVSNAIDEDSLELAVETYLHLREEVEKAKGATAKADRKALDKLSDQFGRVKTLLDELALAGIDISESEDRLHEAEEAMHRGDTAEAKVVLTDLEEIGSNVRGNMVSAAKDLIASARQRLTKAAKHWEKMTEAEELLRNAQEAYKRGRIDEAIELAKMAEKNATRRVERLIHDAEIESSGRIDAIGGRLFELKRVMKDLGRADISIEGVDEDMRGIESSLEEGDFEGAEANLSSLEDITMVLTSGLEVAARDLLGRTEEDIQAAAAEGLSITRGEQIFATARSTLEEGRYVETLEYCKVIEDIIKRGKQKSTLEDITVYMDSVREDMEDLVSRGLTMKRTENLLDDIREAAAEGDLDRARLMIEGLGNSMKDFLTAPNLPQVTTETTDVDTQLKEAKEFLIQAHSILDTGRKEELKQVIARARIRLGDGAAGEALLQDVKDMAEMAESLGAEVGDTQKILADVETKLEEDPENALESLERVRNIIRKSVEGMAEGAEPEIILEMPEEGLAEDEWTRYQFYIKNAGKVPANHVRVRLSGDLEVRGLDPIPRLSPGERLKVEGDVRPKVKGNIPIEVEVAYERYFDGKDTRTTQDAIVTASPAGTYIVEDIFLVHADGRLINHQSRKTLDDIDEDIFSGMLTVVQDFVKDSFRQRTRVGLKRLEFGESKIIIERGSHVYLATVLLGEEPELLALYMAEVINEIERGYSEKLEKWTGLLSDLEGIDALVRKLIFLTDDNLIQGPEGTELALGSAINLIRGGKTLGLDLSESESLLTAAKAAVDKDMDRAWTLMQDAVNLALKTQQEMQKKLKAALELLEQDLADLTQAGLEDMAELGWKHEESKDAVEKARKALARGNFDMAASIVTSLEEAVSAIKEQVISEKIGHDLERLDATLAFLENEGADASELRERLDKSRKALAEGKLGEVNKSLETADSLSRQMKEDFLLKKYKGDLESITGILQGTTSADAVSEETRKIVELAMDAAKKSDLDQLELLIGKARDAILSGTEDGVEEREPRLLVKTPIAGLQSGTWNRFILEVVNRGNWPAKEIGLVLHGDMKVKGEMEIDRIDPGETREVEIGLWPRTEGEATMDLEVSYKRVLDDAPYVMRDIREPRVAPKGTYPVEDALLFLGSGELIIHESRRFRESSDKKTSDDGLEGVRDFIRNASGDAEGSFIKRMDTGEGKALLERGDSAYLVAVVRDREPELLPFYMLRILQDVENRFGDELKNWKGDSDVLEELRKILRRLLFVTDSEDVHLGPLAASPIAAGLLYGTPRKERKKWARTMEREIESAVEEGGIAKGVGVLESALGGTLAERGLEGSTPTRPSRTEGYSIEIEDATLKEFIEIAKEIDKAVNKARGKAGLEAQWPVSKIAIRASDSTVAAAANSFKPMILSHANAKEIDILEKGEFWKGADLKMQINEEALAKSYAVWAKKIELILKSQDPWKIKTGIDKGGYEMGIEGQVIHIFPGMVSFKVIMPPHVVVQQFQGGMVFMDTTLTESIKAEGFANEIIKIILEARKELAVEDSDPVSIKIVADSELKALLYSVKEYMMEEVNAKDLQFVEDVGETDYVLDCEIRDDKFTLAVEKA
ncbi:MAG: DUF5915 domain-containing protein [Thermoplasmata archaeon]